MTSNDKKHRQRVEVGERSFVVTVQVDNHGLLAGSFEELGGKPTGEVPITGPSIAVVTELLAEVTKKKP